MASNPINLNNIPSMGTDTLVKELTGTTPGEFSPDWTSRQLPGVRPVPFVPPVQTVPAQIPSNMTGRSQARFSSLNELTSNLSGIANTLAATEYQKKLSKAYSLYSAIDSAIQAGNTNYLHQIITPQHVKLMNEALGLHLQPLEKQLGSQGKPFVKALQMFLQKKSATAVNAQQKRQQIQNLVQQWARNNTPGMAPQESLAHMAARNIQGGQGSLASTALSGIYGKNLVTDLIGLDKFNEGLTVQVQDLVRRIHQTDANITHLTTMNQAELEQAQAGLQRARAAMLTAQTAQGKMQAAQTQAAARINYAKALQLRSQVDALRTSVDAVNKQYDTYLKLYETQAKAFGIKNAYDFLVVHKEVNSLPPHLQVIARKVLDLGDALRNLQQESQKLMGMKPIESSGGVAKAGGSMTSVTPTFSTPSQQPLSVLQQLMSGGVPQ